MGKTHWVKQGGHDSPLWNRLSLGRARTLNVVGLLRPDCELVESFIAPNEAEFALNELREHANWRDDLITIFGKTHPVPRRTALYGDPGTSYSYSRIHMEALPWTPLLESLRERVATAAGSRFNTVLLNLYRDGSDSNGWHADDEPELGPEPVIASVSLGATRTMQFKRRDNGQRFSLDLRGGSLLVMSGDSQRDWLHCIPKRQRFTAPRINLTYRFVAL